MSCLRNNITNVIPDREGLPFQHSEIDYNIRTDIHSDGNE